MLLDDLLPPRESVASAHRKRLWQIKAECSFPRLLADHADLDVAIVNRSASRKPSMTSVTMALPAIVVEFRMGEKGYEEDDHRSIASVGCWAVNRVQQAA
jgi:hypothetical protein